MRVALLSGLRKIEVCQAPEPKIKAPDDVLVQVEAVGICGSDAHYFNEGKIGRQTVRFPQSVGHETAARVLETGPAAEGLSIGQPIVLEPAISCGICDQCLAGRHNTCRRLSFMGCPGQAAGTLSERLAVPARCCFPVPESVSISLRALAEPLSIAIHARRLAGPVAGTSVAVLGTGPIGLCVIDSLIASGAGEIYATDLLKDRLALASGLGAVWTGSPREGDIVQAILKEEPLGLDLAFECAGSQETLDQAIELLRPGGTMVLVGIPQSERVHFDVDLLRRKELRIQNVRRQNGCLGLAIDRISRSTRLESLVTHRFRLDQVQEAFETVSDRRDGVVKALVCLGER